MKWLMCQFLFCTAGLLPLSTWASKYQSVDVYFVGHAPPQFFVDDQKVTGFMYHLVHTAFQNSKVEAIFRIKPWARAQLSALNEDSVIVMIKDPVRESNFYFSKSVIYQNQQKLFRMKSESKVPMNEASIGVIRGYKFGPNFTLRSEKVIELNSFDQGLDLLKIGRIHYLLGEALAVSCLAAKKKMEIEADYLVDKTEVYLARSKKFSKDILDDFDKGFAMIPKKTFASSLSQAQAHCD